MIHIKKIFKKINLFWTSKTLKSERFCNTVYVLYGNVTGNDSSSYISFVDFYCMSRLSNKTLSDKTSEPVAWKFFNYKSSRAQQKEFHRTEGGWKLTQSHLLHTPNIATLRTRVGSWPLTPVKPHKMWGKFERGGGGGVNTYARHRNTSGLKTDDKNSTSACCSGSV